MARAGVAAGRRGVAENAARRGIDERCWLGGGIHAVYRRGLSGEPGSGKSLAADKEDASTITGRAAALWQSHPHFGQDSAELTGAAGTAIGVVARVISVGSTGLVVLARLGSRTAGLVAMATFGFSLGWTACDPALDSALD